MDMRRSTPLLTAGCLALSIYPASVPGQQTNRALLDNPLNTVEFSGGKVHALVGVDPLGRVAIAIDSDKDGRAEQLLLFTDKGRLDGTWSKRLDDASVEIRRGAVLVTSGAESYAISLAVSTADTPPVPAWATERLIRTDGIELARLEDERGIAYMAALDHDLLSSWPKQFETDLLAPGPKE
jgi:hypothetical protein